MSERERIYVFAYDISDDRRRNAVADLLETDLARVQMSVFEGLMRPARARRLGARVKARLAPGDKLRIYCLPRQALAQCDRFGGAPLPERQDFWLI